MPTPPPSPSRGGVEPTDGACPVSIPGLTVVRERGRGAHSVVHQVERDGVQYALKILAPVTRPDCLALLAREAALLAGLDHPGLVRVHSVGENDGVAYLIMDLVEGTPLGQALGRRADEWRVATIGAQVADALATAHRAGLVHRDIKPENILVEPQGRARLIDFDLAVHACDLIDDVAVGTFTYGAPEQTGMLHRPVDGRADLYALGAVLFECLTGRPPFAADGTSELIRSHLVSPVPDPRVDRPDLSPAMAGVVVRLLAKDPDDRYQCADALRADLDRIAAGEREFPLSAEVLSTEERDPLVGREQELTTLRAHWDRALAGHGGAVLLEGAIGSGRSRLARELTLAARLGGRLVLTGAPGTLPTPLDPLRAALDQYLRTLAGLDAPARATAVRKIVEAAGEARGLLAEVSPALADLLNGNRPTDAGSGRGRPENPSPAAERLSPGPELPLPDRPLDEALAGFLVALADQYGGGVLVLDDLDRSDAATRQVIRRLAPLLPSSRLLLVVTGADTDTVQETWDDLGAALDLRLPVGPLDESAVTTLLAHRLGSSSVPQRLVSRLSRCSGGNALAVHEYLRVVLHAGLLRPVWGTWVLDTAGLDALDLPDDVRNLLGRRIDTIGALTRRVLVLGAGVGARFTPGILTAIARTLPEWQRPREDEPTEAELAAALTEATVQGLVEPVGDQFVFVHERVRETLLERLSTAERQHLHQTIAEALDRIGGNDPASTYARARHYLQGDPDQAPDLTFRALADAGTLAMAEHSAHDAVEYFAQAHRIAVRAGLTPSGGFHTAYGTAAIRVGQGQVAEEHLQLALAEEQDPMRRAHLYGLVARMHHLRGEGVLARKAAYRGLAEIGRPVPENLGALALSSAARALAGAVARRIPRRLLRLDHRRRDHYWMEQQLLGFAAHGAALAVDVPLMGLLSRRPALPAAVLGPGTFQAMDLAGAAMTARIAHRRRRAERLAARSREMAAAVEDPRTVAVVEYMLALGSDVIPPAHATSGEASQRVLRHHGRWLDLGDYLDLVAILGSLMLVRGNATQAAELFQTCRHRTGGDGLLGHQYATVGARAAALLGNAAEAAAELDVVRSVVCANPHNVGGRLDLAVAELFVALERGDVGATVDEAIAGFTAFGRSPGQVWTQLRPFWVYQAFGRLAQAAAAEPQARDRRMAMAADAVRALRRAANGPLLRGFHVVAAAQLDVLSGRPNAALRRMACAETWLSALNAPLVDYEATCARARALQALGRTEAVQRHARMALMIATNHGWATRQQWVCQEFGIAHLDAGLPVVPRHPGRTRSAGRSRTDPTGAHQQLHHRLQALHQVSLAAATVLDPRELARVALDEIVQIFAAERAFLFLSEGTTGQLNPYLGRDDAGLDLTSLTGYGASLLERVRLSGEPLVVTGGEEGAALGSQSTLIHGLRSIMVAPIQLKGRFLGMVYLDSRAAKGIFTEDDVDILSAIATQVGVAITTANAAQLEVDIRAAKRERDLTEVLRSAMISTSSSLDPHEVARRMTESFTRALDFDAALSLFRTDDGALSLYRYHSARSLTPDFDIPEPVAAHPILTDLLSATDPRRGSDPAALGPLARRFPAGTRHWLQVPLLVRGEHCGVLVVGTTADRPYTEAEGEVLAALAGQGMVAYGNAQLFQQIQELAVRDSLTDLYNRRHFLEIVHQRVDSLRDLPAPIATLMVDIDHFKDINDRFGHSIGDEVIRQVAERLHGCLREEDVICRYGGEEFAVLLTGTSARKAGWVGERLHQAVGDRPIQTSVGQLPVSVSIGVARGAERPQDVRTLLDRADAALYVAKRTGRDRVSG